jgi:hypothetical protein
MAPRGAEEGESGAPCECAMEVASTLHRPSFPLQRASPAPVDDPREKSWGMSSWSYRLHVRISQVSGLSLSSRVEARTPPIVISTGGRHTPSCHLDRRPPYPLLSSRPKAAIPPLVISTEGRRPEWRDLAANKPCPALAPRSAGRTENHFGRESASQIELRNLRGQMSRPRPAAQRPSGPRPLDMTKPSIQRQSCPAYLRGNTRKPGPPNRPKDRTAAGAGTTSNSLALLSLETLNNWPFREKILRQEWPGYGG